MLTRKGRTLGRTSNNSLHSYHVITSRHVVVVFVFVIVVVPPKKWINIAIAFDRSCPFTLTINSPVIPHVITSSWCQGVASRHVTSRKCEKRHLFPKIFKLCKKVCLYRLKMEDLKKSPQGCQLSNISNRSRFSAKSHMVMAEQDEAIRKMTKEKEEMAKVRQPWKRCSLMPV